MSRNESSSSPEGKKRLLVPKRKRGVTWKAKPRRATRNFFAVTPSARTAHSQTEADIFEDLVRKSAQAVDIVSQLPPASKLVHLDPSAVNGGQEAYGAQVPLDQSSTLARHQQVVPALQKLQPDDATKALHFTDKRERRLSAHQRIESSEHHECVSMELTCSSSLKNAEDVVTPAIVHVLETKAHNVDMSRVRSFLDQLAGGSQLNGATSNPYGHALGMSRSVSALTHERSWQNTSPQDSSHEGKRQANEKEREIPQNPVALTSPEYGTLPLKQGEDLSPLQLSKSCTYLATNDGLNGAGKQSDGVLDGVLPDEKSDDAIQLGVGTSGVELDGNSCICTGHLKEAVSNGVDGLRNKSTFCEPKSHDTSIETLRDRDTDEVLLSDCKVAFTLQDSRDESVDECLSVKSCQKENIRYGRVGGSNNTVTKRVEGASSIATKEGEISRAASEKMRRGSTIVAKELAFSTSISSSTGGKKKLSLSRKRNVICSAVCNTLNATGKSILAATSLGCPGDNKDGKDTSLAEQFSTLQLTPILPLPPPSSPGGPGPLTSTPISNSLSHAISATLISRQLPHTSTPDKVSSIGSTMERLLDFDEIGFDASTSISQTTLKGPDPTQHCGHQQAPLPAIQKHLNVNPKAMHTLAKKRVLVRTPGLIKAAKTSKLLVMQRDEGSPGTTPPSCVLIRLHEGADKDRKKVHYHPCAFKDEPEDVLVTIVNRERRL
eukprot:Em0010g846a